MVFAIVFESTIGCTFRSSEVFTHNEVGIKLPQNDIFATGRFRSKNIRWRLEIIVLRAYPEVDNSGSEKHAVIGL